MTSPTLLVRGNAASNFHASIKKLSLALPVCAVRYGNSVCSAEKLKN